MSLDVVGFAAPEPIPPDLKLAVAAPIPRAKNTRPRVNLLRTLFIIVTSAYVMVLFGSGFAGGLPGLTVASRSRGSDIVLQ